MIGHGVESGALALGMAVVLGWLHRPRASPGATVLDMGAARSARRVSGRRSARRALADLDRLGDRGREGVASSRRRHRRRRRERAGRPLRATAWARCSAPGTSRASNARGVDHRRPAHRRAHVKNGPCTDPGRRGLRQTHACRRRDRLGQDRHAGVDRGTDDRDGHGAVVIDPKGDELLRAELKSAAARRGAPFMEWSPEGPVAYNPYARGSARRSPTRRSPAR